MGIRPLLGINSHTIRPLLTKYSKMVAFFIPCQKNLTSNIVYGCRKETYSSVTLYFCWSVTSRIMFFFYVSRDLTLLLAESLLTAICLVRIFAVVELRGLCFFFMFQEI